MWAWLMSWLQRSAPEPKRKIELLPGRHTISPYRLLDWYSQHVDHQLDPLQKRMPRDAIT